MYDSICVMAVFTRSKLHMWIGKAYGIDFPHYCNIRAIAVIPAIIVENVLALLYSVVFAQLSAAAW